MKTELRPGAQGRRAGAKLLGEVKEL